MRTVPALPPCCSQHAYVVAYPHASAPPSLTVCVLFPGFPPPLFTDVPGRRSCPRRGHCPCLYEPRFGARPLPLPADCSPGVSCTVPGLYRPCLSQVCCCGDRDAGCCRTRTLFSLSPDSLGSSHAAALTRERPPAA